MQVQQRQHLGHLRGLTRPRRQYLRRESLPLTGFRIDPFVVDPRRLHLDRPSAGEHLPDVVVAVADHQPVPILVDLIDELVDIGGDLGLQSGGQHLPGTVADNLIQQRPTGTAAGVVGLRDIVNYGEHGRAFPTSAPTPVLIRNELDL